MCELIDGNKRQRLATKNAERLVKCKVNSRHLLPNEKISDNIMDRAPQRKKYRPSHMNPKGFRTNLACVNNDGDDTDVIVIKDNSLDANDMEEDDGIIDPRKLLIEENEGDSALFPMGNLE